MNIVKLSDTIHIEEYRIIGTNFVYYSALEPDEPVRQWAHNHGTISYDHSNDGTCWGTIATRIPDLWLEKIPFGVMRFDLMHEHYKACQLLAYHYILQAFPDLITRPSGCGCDDGRIFVYDPVLAATL